MSMARLIPFVFIVAMTTSCSGLFGGGGGGDIIKPDWNAACAEDSSFSECAELCAKDSTLEWCEPVDCEATPLAEGCEDDGPDDDPCESDPLSDDCVEQRCASDPDLEMCSPCNSDISSGLCKSWCESSKSKSEALCGNFIERPAIGIKGTIPSSCLVEKVEGEKCDVTLSVKNDVEGRTYTWSLEGEDASGFSLKVRNDGEKAELKALPGLAVGDHTFTVKVVDAGDPANAAEKDATLKVAEELAISAYRPKDGAFEAAASAELGLTPGERVLFAVNGYQEASAYIWIINGEETTLPYDAEAFTISAGAPEGVKLPDDGDADTNISYVLLTAKSRLDEGTASLTLAVKDGFGNQTDNMQVSLTVAADPCLVPVKIEASSLETYRSVEKAISFTATGGTGPFTWSVTDAAGTDIEGTANAEDTRSFAVTHAFSELGINSVIVAVTDAGCQGETTFEPLDITVNCRLGKVSDIKEAYVYPKYRKSDNDYDGDIKHSWQLLTADNTVVGSYVFKPARDKCKNLDDYSPDLDIRTWVQPDLCVEDIAGVGLQHYNPQKYTYCPGKTHQIVDVHVERIIVEITVKAGDDLDRKEATYRSFVKDEFGRADIRGKAPWWLMWLDPIIIPSMVSLEESEATWLPKLVKCSDVGAEAVDKDLPRWCTDEDETLRSEFDRLEWPN